MGVTADWAFKVNAINTLSTNVPAALASNRIVSNTLYSNSGQYTATSAVPVTKEAFFLATMSGGALTIDLTALTGTNGETVTFDGLKVQLMHLSAPATNSAAITVTAGATNGIDIGGAAWSVVLQPGQQIQFGGFNLVEDVSATAKTIDLAGTLVDALEVSLIAG